MWACRRWRAHDEGTGLASVGQCADALKELTEKLAEVDPATRRKHTLDRSLSCTISDLDVSFSGRLGGDGIEALTQCAEGVVPPAQIKLTVASDDLLSLVDGSLGVAVAWATGRLKIDASVFDVLRLRAIS